MADDEAQGPEDISWEAFDAFSDAPSPLAAFDEPLVWPESMPWDEPAAVDLGAEAAGVALPARPDLAGPEADLDFPPTPEVAAGVGLGAHPGEDAQWQAPDGPLDPDATMPHLQPLAGLGGNAGPASSSAAAAVPVGAAGAGGAPPAGAPRTQSIWSNDLRANPLDAAGLGSVPFPAIYAEAERNGRVPRWRRLDIRPGNAAVIALISVVSLVLVGMFLSVRARNDVPTDASQTPPPGDGIEVSGSLNTIPLTTTVSTGPPPAINLQDLLPPPEVTAPGAATAAGSGTGASTGPGSGGSGAGTAAPATPATTAAPARTQATTGGSGGSGTTTQTTQPTATTEAPTPTTEATTPPATSPPPPDDTTPTTRRTFPTFTVPTYTIPTAPSSSFPFPRP